MMLEELERRNYSAGTTRRYLRFVERFAQHFHKSPDKLGPDHLRSYQAYLLTELKLCPGSVENHVAALRFFFVRTLHRHEFREYLPYPKSPKKLPNILSQEEVARLINASSSLFQRTLLMVIYGTGMRRSELARLKIAHIDSQRMIIHVVDGKGHKDRDLAQNLITRALLANHNLAAPVKPNKMKDRLPKIDANCVNHHGTPPVHTLMPPKSFRRRIIPL